MSGVSAVFSTNSGFIDEKKVVGTLYADTFFEGHRGEEATKVSVAKLGEIKTLMGHGDANEVLKPEIISLLSDSSTYAGISNTLYSKNELHHPPKMEKGKYEISTAVDSIILGKDELIQTTEASLMGTTDNEIISDLFLKYLDETDSLVEASRRLAFKLEGRGGYFLSMLVNDTDKKRSSVVVMRDNLGLKPGCYAEYDGVFYAVSETNGLQQHVTDKSKWRDIKPGSVYIFSDDGLETHQLLESKRTQCIFQGVYFGSPASIFIVDGTDLTEEPVIDDLRQELGGCLACMYPDLKDKDVITYIPASGLGVSKGIANGFERELTETLIKTRGAPRTFQITDPKWRYVQVSVKFDIIGPRVYGKSVVGGDDSIVKGGISRGGTVYVMKGVGGATEFHMMISYTPIFFPCMTNFHKYEKVAAEGLWHLPLEGINKKVAEGVPDVDGVYYQSMDNLTKVFGGRNVCRACSDGIYPVDLRYVPDRFKADVERYHDFLAKSS